MLSSFDDFRLLPRGSGIAGTDGRGRAAAPVGDGEAEKESRDVVRHEG